MLKTFCVAVMAMLPLSAAFAACDADQVKAAVRVQAMLNSMSSSSVADKALVVAWGTDFASLPLDKQQALIRAYADTDACLRGSSRRIVFTRDEKLLAVATPESGIQFVK